jgi:hypothetical protein
MAPMGPLGFLSTRSPRTLQLEADPDLVDSTVLDRAFTDTAQMRLLPGAEAEQGRPPLVMSFRARARHTYEGHDEAEG